MRIVRRAKAKVPAPPFFFAPTWTDGVTSRVRLAAELACPFLLQFAVKVLNAAGMQGRSELDAEVSSLARCRHQNVVNLVGWAPGGAEAVPPLVYEYLPGGNLAQRLAAVEGGALHIPSSKSQ